MAADTAARGAVMADVMTDQRRSLALWSLALAAIAALYISFYPLMGVEDMAAIVENLPEAMINAFGYDEIGTAAGYITSTVYGLLGPVLFPSSRSRPVRGCWPARRRTARWSSSSRSRSAGRACSPSGCSRCGSTSSSSSAP